MSDDYEQTADAAEQEADKLEQEAVHLSEQVDAARKARDDAYADPVIAEPLGDEDGDEGDAHAHAEEVEAAQDEAAAADEGDEEPDQAA